MFLEGTLFGNHNFGVLPYFEKCPCQSFHAVLGCSQLGIPVSFKPNLLIDALSPTRLAEDLSILNLRQPNYLVLGIDGWGFEPFLDCYWVGSRDFNLLENNGVFH